MGTGSNPQPGLGYGDYIPFNGSTWNSQPWNGLYLGSGYPRIQTDNMKFGLQRFGAQQIGYVGDRLTPSYTTEGAYRIECRTPEGGLYGKLSLHFGATWVDEANAPGSLTFRYPAAEAVAEYLVYPNEVWLYRGKDSLPRRKFVIQTTSNVEEEDRVLSVNCEGILSLLGRELIENYNPGGTPSTVEEILRDWLNNHQERLPAIQLGVVDASIGASAFAASIPEQRYILKALRELHDVFGGFFSVTPARRLTWSSDKGTDEGHLIRFGKNAAKVKHEIDYRTIQNRIIVKGEEFDGTPIEVTLTDSASQALYGEISGVYKVNIAVEDSSVLTALGTNELLRRAYPRERWSVDAIDLSQTDRYDYSWEATLAEPGTVLHCVGADFDITTKVFKATRQLEDPVKVLLEVGDTSGGVGTDVAYKTRPDFVQAVAGLIRYVQELEASA